MATPDDPARPASGPAGGEEPFRHGDDGWEQSDANWNRDRWAERDAEWAAKGEADPPDSPLPPAPHPVAAYNEGMRAAGPYLGLGLQIAGSLALFVGLGYAVDRWLGSSPWGIIVGAALGMAGIFALVMRLARDADAQKTRGPSRPR